MNCFLKIVLTLYFEQGLAIPLQDKSNWAGFRGSLELPTCMLTKRVPTQRRDFAEEMPILQWPFIASYVARSIATVSKDTNATKEIKLVQQWKQQFLSFRFPLAVLVRTLFDIGSCSASLVVSWLVHLLSVPAFNVEDTIEGAVAGRQTPAFKWNNWQVHYCSVFMSMRCLPCPAHSNDCELSYPVSSVEGSVQSQLNAQGRRCTRIHWVLSVHFRGFGSCAIARHVIFDQPNRTGCFEASFGWWEVSEVMSIAWVSESCAFYAVPCRTYSILHILGHAQRSNIFRTFE